jgi:hypothetical protein
LRGSEGKDRRYGIHHQMIMEERKSGSLSQRFGDRQLARGSRAIQE